MALAAVALLAVLAMAIPAPGGAGAKSPVRGAQVSLKVATATQRALLAQKGVMVKVRVKGKTGIRLSARLGDDGRLFRANSTRFKKRGTQTRRIKLRLTKRGTKKLATCGAKTVRITARYGKRKKNASRTKRRLARDPKLCGKPRPPVKPTKSVCDPLDPAICLQPFPSDYYTEPDASTPTGLRLEYPLEGMPKNKSGVPVDPTAINRSDGFSPGSPIVTKIPGVDNPAAFETTGFVPQTDLAEYDRPDQPVVVYDTTTGERWPIWAELDSNPTTIAPYQATDGVGGINLNPSNTGPVNLIVRPAKNFVAGHRYVVAFRNLKDASGGAVEAQTPFRTCRDGIGTDDPALLYRCEQLDRTVFPELARQGISRESLYLAWDFTIASERNTTGRAVQIRDDAYARLGDTDLADRSLDGSSSPTVEVTNACGGGYTDCSVTTGDGLPPQPGPNVYRYVDGLIKNVPCYLNRNGCPPGSFFEFNPDGTVKFDPAFKTDVPFRCLIPDSADDGGIAVPGRVGLFGHGLLGDHSQLTVQAELANRNGQTWCATDWAGFSALDLADGVIPAMADLSNFHKLVDRMQQGFVNFMMLGRAAIHPDGLASKPEFQIGGDSVIDVSQGDATRLLYMGISQGGIMGGALTALEPDVDHGVLAVPGMIYSTLLQRSVDFDHYIAMPFVGLWTHYPDEAIRPLGLGLMQLLWDRGEGNGYAANLVAGNELPNTSPHEVLLQVAVGDHQVANVAAEVEARTIGATLYAPAVNPGRHSDTDPFLGIAQAAPPITDGNAIVYYDGGPPTFTGSLAQGSKVAPALNLPPRPEWGYGGDSHNFPWRSEDGWDHEGGFLDGNGVAACASGGYCYSNGWPGP
ncbi:MAG TPA: hypothetical protein VMF31_13270 [Solirubrobacterales bacterium]|nr:hypothetical protein [Solirubrobacterales bacterium]